MKQLSIDKIYCSPQLSLTVALVYVFIYLMPSMYSSREGLPHITTNVIYPLVGDSIDITMLVKHYKGG